MIHHEDIGMGLVTSLPSSPTSPTLSTKYRNYAATPQTPIPTTLTMIAWEGIKVTREIWIQRTSPYIVKCSQFPRLGTKIPHRPALESGVPACWSYSLPCSEYWRILCLPGMGVTVSQEASRRGQYSDLCVDSDFFLFITIIVTYLVYHILPLIFPNTFPPHFQLVHTYGARTFFW